MGQLVQLVSLNKVLIVSMSFKWFTNIAKLATFYLNWPVLMITPLNWPLLMIIP